MQTRAFRSLLFVPATKPDWIRKAADLPADALVLDLEDAVPEREKAAARRSLAATIPALSETDKGVFVRINPQTSPHWLDDLEAVVLPGITGIALPKAYRPEEVVAVAEAIDAAERRADVEPGTTDLQVLLETALGIHDAFRILSASPRVRSFFGGSARDADANREVGFRWTPGGHETRFLRAKILLEGRAAGVPHPISGTWIDVDDHDGLRAFATENRDLGYEGMYVIHPSHVEIVNRAFTPSAEELERYRTIIAEFERAEAQGLGAVTVDGAMIDAAVVTRAHQVLALTEHPNHHPA